jgi:hypothetical protein
MDWLEWSNPVARWWFALVTVSVVNIVAWVVVRRRVLRGLEGVERAVLQRSRWVVALSGVYVFGCAFRSVLPRADVQRICLFDTWFSNVFVGRSVATVAELSFVVQGAIVLHFVSTQLGSTFGRRVAVAIVAMITCAECFSWYAVISTNYLGNAVEESLWTISYSLVGVALLVLSTRAKGTLKQLARFSAVGCLLYVCFMLSTDVPMYIGRLLDDTQQTRTYLGLSDGVHDLLTRWVVTHDITEWRTEIPWMSLYFSFAVWLSIALCVAPVSAEAVEKLLVERA